MWAKELKLFPLTNETYVALLLRLTFLVVAEEEGEYKDVFCRWFQAIRLHLLIVSPELQIPEEAKVLEADAVVFFTTYHIA